MIIFVYYINIMNTPPAPRKSRKRQSPMYGSPGRQSPMYGSPGTGSVFNFASPGRGSTFESPVKGTPKKLRALQNSPSILTYQKDAKPGRIVNKQGNAAVKSYEKDRLSQESLKNELAVYEHLDNVDSGKEIRYLINASFMKLNNTSNIYPGINLIFPKKKALYRNKYNSELKTIVDNLYLTYHDIKDVFINRSIIAPPYIDENGVKWPNDPELYEEDKLLRKNIKTALEENGIIYAHEDDIDEEIKSNLFRTNDGNALLLDFETSEVKTFKGGIKKTNRKRNIKKRTRKKEI